MVVARCCEQDRKKVHFLTPQFRQLVAIGRTRRCLGRPDKFDSLHRKNGFFDEGMGAIFSVKEGTAELQSFCVQPSKFTSARAELSRGGPPMKSKRIDTLVYSTVTELIEELVNRETFVGVVVASDKEHKRRDTVHDTFNTYASLNNQDQVVTILKTAATNIEEGHP
jgi:hypothetical protein